MLRLQVAPARGAPFEHRFDGESLVIGRSAAAGLVLDDPFLSRLHARLVRNGPAVFLEDLGSRLGTLLNGRPVREPTPIRPGDVVRISAFTIRVQGPEPGEESDDPLGSATVLRRAADVLTDTSRDPSGVEGEEALRRYAERLRLLNEIHQALGTSLGLDELLELILDRVFDHLRPERGAIFLRTADGQHRRAASRAAAGTEEELPCSRSLVREVAEKGMAALVLDLRTDQRFAGAQSLQISGVRSLVAAPLLGPEGPLGMIALDSRLLVRQFTEEDMALLISLASVAALHLRNAALALEAAERHRLEEEVALARRIQLALLPDHLPEIAGYELHGDTVPSRGVSGDYYQAVVRRSGEECVLLVADVAGKGMAASLLTASLEALAAGPIEDGLPPDQICDRLSRQLHRRTPPEKYATAFVAVLHTASGLLRYTNAGHNPPLLVRATGEVERLGPTGLPIALVPAAPYRLAETLLSPGDLLVIYTDGLVEAASPEDEEYGLDRLTEACLRLRSASCEGIAAALAEDLEAFAHGIPFADDRTLLLARRRRPR
jgi:serine phosphatase RsbU (regulator of sigma subunit)